MDFYEVTKESLNLGSNKHFHFSLKLDLLKWLDEKFDNRYHKKVKNIAESYESLSKNFFSVCEEDLIDVLEFLEMIGYFVRRKAIDIVTVWENFGALGIGIYLIAKDYIEKDRKKDPQLWLNVKFLFEKLKVVEENVYKRSLDEQIKIKKFISAWKA